MKALILAAGYATRLYPLTRNFPKPLLQVGDRTIIDFLLERLQGQGVIDRVFIVTNERYHPVFSRWAGRLGGEGRYRDFDLRIVNDGTRDNDTRLGAVADLELAIAEGSIDDDLLVAAGDNIFTFDFRELFDTFARRATDVVVVTRISEIERRRRSGVVELDADGRVTGFEEKPHHPKSEYICPALYILRRGSLPLVSKYLAQGGQADAPGHFIAWLHRQVPVHAYVMRQSYYDIGTRESYEKVCATFAGARE